MNTVNTVTLIASVIVVAAELTITYYLWRYLSSSFGKYWKFHSYDVVVFSWLFTLLFGLGFSFLIENGLFISSSEYLGWEYVSLAFLPLLITSFIYSKMSRLGQVPKGITSVLAMFGMGMVFVLLSYDFIFALTSDIDNSQVSVLYSLFKLIWVAVLILVFWRLQGMGSKWGNYFIGYFLLLIGLVGLKYIFVSPALGPFILEVATYLALLIGSIYAAASLDKNSVS